MSFYKLSNDNLVSAISVLVKKIFAKNRSDVHYFLTDFSEKYITPLVNQLEHINIAEYLDSNDSAETITNLLLQNSVSLANKTNTKNKSFVRLPEEVKVARYHGKVAFDDWKQLNFPLEGDAHDIYRA